MMLRYLITSDLNMKLQFYLNASLSPLPTKLIHLKLGKDFFTLDRNIGIQHYLHQFPDAFTNQTIQISA